MKQDILFFLFITILIVVFAEKSFSYDLPDTLVKLSNGFIDSQEFLNRCDFSYPLKKNNISDDSLKKEFLYSIIAERLWAAESDKMNLDTSTEFKYALDPIRKFYVIDELYKEEISSKVIITQHEISEGIARFREKLKVQILSSPDSNIIYHVYDSLLSGKTFKEIPKEISRTNEPVDIIFGQIQDENVENIIYILKTGYLTKPIFSGVKWFIFKLIERNKTDISGLSQDAITMNVEQIINRRRSSFWENWYRDSLFSPLRIETNGEIFKKLCSVVSDILNERSKEIDRDTSKAVELYQSDLKRIFTSVGENNFEKPFILFEKDPLTLRESLSLLPYKPFRIKNPSLGKVTNILKAYFRYVIEQEVLYREAIKNNIQYRRNVQENISLWKKSFQAGMYSSDIWNSLSQNKKNKSDNDISYKVLPSKTIEGLLINMDNLQKGISFDSLFKQNGGYILSEKDSAFTPALHSLLEEQIKTKSDSVHKGVFGPSQIKGDYILLKRIEKKETVNDSSFTQSQIKHSFEDTMEKNTASLFVKYNVRINTSLLQKMKISPLNTFTVQKLGFGNQLPAFPIIIPYYEWIFRLSKNPLP